ncbi:MAG: hypothetical protein ABI565_06840 [Vicinamibacteria bacterium]
MLGRAAVQQASEFVYVCTRSFRTLDGDLLVLVDTEDSMPFARLKGTHSGLVDAGLLVPRANNQEDVRHALFFDDRFFGTLRNQTLRVPFAFTQPGRELSGVCGAVADEEYLKTLLVGGNPALTDGMLFLYPVRRGEFRATGY